MSKQKSWRKFKKKRWKPTQVRWFCALLIAIELAVLGGQGRLPFPVIEVREGSEVVVYQRPKAKRGDEVREEGAEKAQDALQKNNVYGIRIRLKEGMVDFYRKEELKE